MIKGPSLRETGLFLSLAARFRGCPYTALPCACTKNEKKRLSSSCEKGRGSFSSAFLKKNGETILPDSRTFRPTVLYLLPAAAIQSECVDELFMRLFSQIVK